MVESRLPKPLVAGSIPVSRSKIPSVGAYCKMFFAIKCSTSDLLIIWIDYVDNVLLPICCTGVRCCHLPQRQRSLTNRSPQA